MLAADVHLGTKNCDYQMEPYVFKHRTDGHRSLSLSLSLYARSSVLADDLLFVSRIGFLDLIFTLTCGRNIKSTFPFFSCTLPSSKCFIYCFHVIKILSIPSFKFLVSYADLLFFNSGTYIIDLRETSEKLQLAARVIVRIESPADIIVQSARSAARELLSRSLSTPERRPLPVAILLEPSPIISKLHSANLVFSFPRS